MKAQKPQPGGCPLLKLFGSKEGFSPVWMEGGEGKRGDDDDWAFCGFCAEEGRGDLPAR